MDINTKNQTFCHSGRNSTLLKAALEEKKYEDKYYIQTILMDDEEFRKRKKRGFGEGNSGKRD